MMKWLDNLQSIAENNKAGNCPFCDSHNTDHGFVLDDENSKMGHGAIWCNDCKKAYHISRIKISNDMRIKDIPKNLDFKAS